MKLNCQLSFYFHHSLSETPNFCKIFNLRIVISDTRLSTYYEKHIFYLHTQHTHVCLWLNSSITFTYTNLSQSHLIVTFMIYSDVYDL